MGGWHIHVAHTCCTVTTPSRRRRRRRHVSPPSSRPKPPSPPAESANDTHATTTSQGTCNSTPNTANTLMLALLHESTTATRSPAPPSPRHLPLWIARPSAIATWQRRRRPSPLPVVLSRVCACQCQYNELRATPLPCRNCVTVCRPTTTQKSPPTRRARAQTNPVNNEMPAVEVGVRQLRHGRPCVLVTCVLDESKPTMPTALRRSGNAQIVGRGGRGGGTDQCSDQRIVSLRVDPVWGVVGCFDVK